MVSFSFAGPGPKTPEEAITLLDNFVSPSFEMFMKWEREGKVVGGVPAGDRAIVMIVEAESNHDVDRMLRSLPLWPLVQWKVIPLESAAGRLEIERENVKKMKAMKK
jgi:hypothetical protein